jgi:uncharacterized protein (TIGR03382 family)
VLTHELGHVLGLGSACEAGEPCTAEEDEATMNGWSTSACDTHASTLGADDYAGVAALYGPPCHPFSGDTDTGATDTGTIWTGDDPDVHPAGETPAASPGCGCATGSTAAFPAGLLVAVTVFLRRRDGVDTMS